MASVSTPPVTAGEASTALTWTYGYSGDLLTSECPPGTTTACTKYSYITDGSHAATAVLNSSPTAYYRLDDPSGTTAAANEVPVDDLTTVNPPAEEMNTTSGPGLESVLARISAEVTAEAAASKTAAAETKISRAAMKTSPAAAQKRSSPSAG